MLPVDCAGIDAAGSYENRWYPGLVGGSGLTTETVATVPQQQQQLLCAETLLAWRPFPVTATQHANKNRFMIKLPSLKGL